MVHKDATIYGHHGIKDIIKGMNTFRDQYTNVYWVFHKFDLIGRVESSCNNEEQLVRVSFTFDRYWGKKDEERLKCTATEYIDFNNDGLMMSIGYIKKPSEPIPSGYEVINEVKSNDVLCVVGNRTNRRLRRQRQKEGNAHPGNQHYRQLVMESNSFYQAATKLEKLTIIRGIVDKIHNLDPPGRFLIKYEKGYYVEIEYERAVDKTREAFRESDKKSTDSTTEVVPAVDNEKIHSPKQDSTEEVLTAVDNEKMPSPNKPQELRGSFFRLAKAKTELCRHYITPEGCAFGDKCNYAHGEHELLRNSNGRNHDDM